MSNTTVRTRFKHAWNAFFKSRDPTDEYEYSNRETYRPIVGGYSYRPDRVRLSYGNEKSIITSVYNRIALDVSSVTIEHVRLDNDDRFKEVINSSLNTCLTLDANKDQTGRAFIQDVVLSMLDEGCVAIVPTDTTDNPSQTDSYDILSMRVGKITQWYPDTVRVKVYNENSGEKEEIILPKTQVGIIENPFYTVMNESNSTLKRLIRKLALMDITDEQNASGKLDLILSLPYLVRSEVKKKEAKQRLDDIQMQLAGSKYGIAYTDGTEKITQLNRSVENQLLTQVTTLTENLYAQLGITAEIMNGTANEQTMLNYNNRVIEPILSAITDEIKRKFLTKTARSQGQSIMFFDDPFKLIPINNIAEIADKFTRNEILTSNEVRGIIGYKPVNDPNADVLRNKNLNQSAEQMAAEGSLPIKQEGQNRSEQPIDLENYEEQEGNVNYE